MRKPTLVKLGWRNLWRNKRRTAITVMSVAGAVWVASTFVGIGEYAYSQMIDASATMGFGHVTLAQDGYNDAPSLAKRLPQAEALAAAAKAQPMVRDAVVRVVGQGMFATARRTTGGLLLGIDPERETTERNLFLRKITVGEVFKADDPHGALVGARLAKLLELELGSKLVWTATDTKGEIVSEVARVRGIFRTGVEDVDIGTVLLPIKSVRRVLGYGPNAGSVVSVFVTEHRDSAPVRDALRGALAKRTAGPPVEVLTWQQTQPEMASYTEVDRASNYIFQMLIALVVAAGILNTILMSVLERRRELGVMLAVGLLPSQVFRLVMWESALIGVTGLVVGAVISVPFAYYMATVGIDAAALMPEQVDIAGVVFDMRLGHALTTTQLLMIPAVVFALTAIAAVYPAFKAAWLQPVESLRLLQ